MGIRGEIYSVRMRSKTDKRTYFFNIKENRTGDIFMNIVESKKHSDTDFERHQIVVFQEDLTDFLKAFNSAVAAMKKKKAGNSYDGSAKGHTS